MKVIIDGNYQVHRAVFSASELYSTSGEYTGGIFIFLKMMNSLHNGERIVVFDGGVSRYRRELYPEYKNRKHDTKIVDSELKDKFRFTFEQLDKILPAMGIPCIRIQGEEADDVIYRLAQDLSKKYDVAVVSDDEDYSQFVSINTPVIRPMKKKDLWDVNDFIKEYGFKPDGYLLYRAMVGDKSDMIEGIDKVGEVTARKVIDYCGEDLTLGGLKEALKYNASWKENKTKENIRKGLDILERNILLMDLSKCRISNKEVYKAYEKAKKESDIDYDFVKSAFERFDFHSLDNLLAKLKIKRRLLEDASECGKSER